MIPNRVNCLSLYAFQGDARQHQLSFPAHALIEIDPAQHPRNGWMYGTYYDTHFHKGWFPSSYVQYRRSSTPPTTLPPLLEGQQQLQAEGEMGNAAGNRPRFTDTYSGSTYSPNYSNRNQENQRYSIPETRDDSSRTNTSTIYSHSSMEEEEDHNVQDIVNDNGFDVATNEIMGGKIARAGNDLDEDDDDDDNEWDKGHNSKANREIGQSKRAFWGRVRLQGSNHKKIKPVVVPKAKTPEWNAEPQIILPDGSIIQEYKTPKRGLFSHLSAAIQPPSS